MQNVEVSADCLDMLTKVLVAEPSQRMSMEDIKCHRWFLAGLPPGALDMNEFLLRGMEPQASVCTSVQMHSLPPASLSLALFLSRSYSCPSFSKAVCTYPLSCSLLSAECLLRRGV